MPPPASHFVHRAGWLRAAVLGANDGIISTASLIVGVAAQSELREIVDLIQQRPATAHSLKAARLAITDPAIAKLIDMATATRRVREAMEMAAANPEFVFFGHNAATQRSFCARLARLLLRTKVRHINNDP